MRKDVKKAKALLNQSGGKRGGSTMTRVTIPALWARELHINERHRDLTLEFDGNKIIITNNKEEIIMLERLAKRLLEDVEKEIEEMGFIDDSDNADRFLDKKAFNLLKEELKDDDEAYDLTNSLVEEVKALFPEEILEGSYKNNYCYYKTDKGKRKWLELILANETGDTYTEEDIEELM